MRKAKPKQPRQPAPKPSPNRQLPLQTRKVLAEHYRAKYGVR
jgi:hypothetical protein